MKILSDGSQIEPGEIVWVSLSPTLGDEKRKTRPCLVIEAGGSPLDLAIVLPITEGTYKNSKTFLQIDDWKDVGLTKPSAIDCYQIRTVSLERLLKRVGQVDNEILFEVRRRLALFLDIGEEHC